MKKSLMLLAVAAMMVACGDAAKKSAEEKKAAAEKRAQEVVDVKATTAEVKTIDVSETYTAELLPYAENNITPAAAGLHIKQIMVDVGDKVTKGQVLVKLDDTTLKQQEYNLAITQDTYNRMKPVSEAGGVSVQQFKQLENQLNLQKEAIDQLRKNTIITSPISGRVTARNFEDGDLFASMPILHIMQTDKLKALVNVSELYYPDVKVGDKVEITTDVYPGQVFEGEVSRINPAVTAATRTFSVEITIPNKDEVLRPGMSTRATFIMNQRESVVVPAEAVRKQTGSSQRYLFVVNEGKAEYRFVKDGRRVGTDIEIFDGVKAGEMVAITGVEKLMDGKNVNVIKE
jgi:RND family efflux transporter MFP subunit